MPQCHIASLSSPSIIIVVCRADLQSLTLSLNLSITITAAVASNPILMSLPSSSDEVDSSSLKVLALVNNIRMIPSQREGVLRIVEKNKNCFLEWHIKVDGDSPRLCASLQSISNVNYDAGSSTLLISFIPSDGATNSVALFYPFLNPEEDQKSHILLTILEGFVSTARYNGPPTLTEATPSIPNILVDFLTDVGRLYRQTATQIFRKITSPQIRSPQQTPEQEGPPLNPWIVGRQLDLPTSRRRMPQAPIEDIMKLDEPRFRVKIFTEGSPSGQRREIWMRLFHIDSTIEAVNITEVPSDILHRIHKDVFRSDRSEPYYYPDVTTMTEDVERPHLRLLRDILATYAINHPEDSYVQGMNDILAPIVPIMNDFSSSYAVFEKIMKVHGDYFSPTGTHTGNHLSLLDEMLKVADAQLHDRLGFASVGNVPLLFAYRWLLLLFKREVGFTNFPLVLETIFAAPIPNSYELFIALALLLMYREELLGFGYRFDLILQFYSERTGQHDMGKLLDLADQLHQYFISTPYIRLDSRFAQLMHNL